MLNKQLIINTIKANYYLSPDKKGRLLHRCDFTNILYVCIHFGCAVENFFDSITNVSSFSVLVEMNRRTIGIKSDVFTIETTLTVDDEQQLLPYNILKSYYSNYSFEMGREIDATYNFITNNSVFLGKNNLTSFLACMVKLSKNEDAWKRSQFNQDFKHVIELPAMNDGYATLSIIHESPYNSYNEKEGRVNATYTHYEKDFLAASFASCNYLVRQEDYSTLTAIALMECMLPPMKDEGADCFNYTLRCMNIDNILKDL